MPLEQSGTRERNRCTGSGIAGDDHGALAAEAGERVAMLDGGGHDCRVTTPEGAGLVLVVVVVARRTWADADFDSAGS